MSKIRNGFPPERTALDRVSSRPFGLLHVLELVALCFCANLLRLSNPERDCQLTPRIPAPRRLTAQSSRKERLVSWIHPELKRFTFHRVWTRVRPHQRQTLKDRKRDNRRAGRLAALLESRRREKSRVRRPLSAMDCSVWLSACRTTRFATVNAGSENPQRSPLLLPSIHTIAPFC